MNVQANPPISRSRAFVNKVVVNLAARFVTVAIVAVIAASGWAWYQLREPKCVSASVPNVVGLSGDQAKQSIEQVGLQAQIQYEPQAGPLDRGFGQNPEAATHVDCAFQTKVRVSVSSKLPMPNVEGLNQSTAVSRIQLETQRTPRIERVHHPEVSTGTVLSQHPRPGEQTTLDPLLLIAGNPDPVTTPVDSALRPNPTG